MTCLEFKVFFCFGKLKLVLVYSKTKNKNFRPILKKQLSHRNTNKPTVSCEVSVFNKASPGEKNHFARTIIPEWMSWLPDLLLVVKYPYLGENIALGNPLGIFGFFFYFMTKISSAGPLQDLLMAFMLWFFSLKEKMCPIHGYLLVQWSK